MEEEWGYSGRKRGRGEVEGWQGRREAYKGYGRGILRRGGMGGEIIGRGRYWEGRGGTRGEER